ncbi:MAG: hypothetical protein AB1847_23300 [bacterium]
MARKTDPKVVREIDQLLDEYKDSETASILNRKGFVTGDGLPFNAQSVLRIRNAYKLESHRARLIEKGLLTRKQMMELLDISSETLQLLKDKKLISVKEYGDGKSNILYDPPGQEMVSIIRQQTKPLRRRAIINALVQNEKSQEVQYEV